MNALMGFRSMLNGSFGVRKQSFAAVMLSHADVLSLMEV